MTFVAIGVLTLVASYLIFYWRDLEQRSIRWRLYALRDELRYVAIQDQAFRESELFWRLDESLSGFCKHLSEFSLWLIVPAILHKDIPHTAKSVAWKELANSELKPVKRILALASSLLIKSIFLRHFFLFFLLVLSVIGIVPLVIAYDRLATKAKQILLMPESQRGSGTNGAQVTA